jgi:hypothetical protein
MIPRFFKFELFINFIFILAFKEILTQPTFINTKELNATQSHHHYYIEERGKI